MRDNKRAFDGKLIEDFNELRLLEQFVDSTGIYDDPSILIRDFLPLQYHAGTSYFEVSRAGLLGDDYWFILSVGWDGQEVNSYYIKKLGWGRNVFRRLVSIPETRLRFDNAYTISKGQFFREFNFQSHDESMIDKAMKLEEKYIEAPHSTYFLRVAPIGSDSTQLLYKYVSSKFSPLGEYLIRKHPHDDIYFLLKFELYTKMNWITPKN